MQETSLHADITMNSKITGYTRSSIIFCLIINLLLIFDPGNVIHASTAPDPLIWERGDLSESLILAGDAGRMNPQMSKALEEYLNKSAKQRAIIFLGDNVYPRGVPAESRTEGYERSKRILEQQILPAKASNSQILLVPGNHDWDDEGPDGLEAIRRMGTLVNSIAGKEAFLPRNGCPGPEVVKLTGPHTGYRIRH